MKPIAELRAVVAALDEYPDFPKDHPMSSADKVRWLVLSLKVLEKAHAIVVRELQERKKGGILQ